MPHILLAGVVTSVPKALNPANGHPHISFFLRADGDNIRGRVWKISCLDEVNLGAERIQAGDVLAVFGALDVGVEKGRISYKIEARQLLFLRNRSVAKATQEQFSGFARSRTG